MSRNSSRAKNGALLLLFMFSLHWLVYVLSMFYQLQVARRDWDAITFVILFLPSFLVVGMAILTFDGHIVNSILYRFLLNVHVPHHGKHRRLNETHLG